MINHRIEGVNTESEQAKALETIEASASPLAVLKAEEPFIYEFVKKYWGTFALSIAFDRMLLQSERGEQYAGPERRRKVRTTFSPRVATAILALAEFHDRFRQK